MCERKNLGSGVTKSEEASGSGDGFKKKIPPSLHSFKKEKAKY